MGKRHRQNEYAGVVQKLEERNVPQKREVTIFRDGSAKDKVEEKIPLRTFPIMIGVPMDEVMFSQFFLLFMRNIHPMPWDGFTATTSTYLPEARNKVHNEFLDAKQYDWLFMLDSDVICPPHTVERLLARQLPIVAGYYVSKSPLKENCPVVYDFLKEDNGFFEWTHRAKPGEGLEKVGGVGMGCVMMSREVAEKLGRDPYNMNHGGEDLEMCKKLMELDIPLYVDWNINCSHLGIKWY